MERLLESFDGEEGEREATSYATNSFALTSEATNSPGRLARSGGPGWRLLLPGTGGRVLARQEVARTPAGGRLEVAPRVAQHGSTVFAVNNPDVIISLVLRTNEIVVDLDDVIFDRVGKDFGHTCSFFIVRNCQVFLIL